MTPTTDPFALGWQCYQAGLLPDAEAAFARAVRDRPDHADAWCMLGVVRKARGDRDGAAAAYREALRARPGFPEALNNLGNLLTLQDRPGEAATHLRELIRLRPDSAEAHNNLGAALRNLGRHDEAEACYREALRLKPAYPDAANNLGNTLTNREKYEEAVGAFRLALRLRPDFPEVHNNLGIALARLGRHAEAGDHYRAALRLKPDYPEALYNLGGLLAESGNPGEAIKTYREALRLRPGYPEALRNLGNTLMAVADPIGATACYEELLRLNPDNPDAHLARAIARLVLGDYERGWPEYEWRWKVAEFTPRPYPQPRWDGASLAGRTVLLWAEQGLGDTIQYARFAAGVKAAGGTVLLECPVPLARLTATCPGVDRVVPRGEPLPAFDVHAPLLSLPALLGTTLAAVPAAVPYLSPEPDLVEKWAAELGPVREVKVGICWQGNPGFRADRQRSFPLARFGPLARVPGVRLYSLQKGPGTEQLTPPGGLGFEVTDLAARLDETGPFRDTAAVINTLDLVIAPDTALAHLAGAIGVPVWVALSTAAHFCWLLDREDSPWYPTARLFRQRRYGDWPDVFARMADALRGLVAARRPGPAEEIAIRVSPGELIDRITILEIKGERLTDADALRVVRAELESLRAARDRAVPASAEMDGLAGDLRAVNAAIWEVEDGVRLCEREQDFGPRFVELARSVYRLNDRRAVLKRRVNALLGSSLREEKGYVAYGGGPDEACTR
jgi:Flp pilus assembly protein TadD